MISNLLTEKPRYLLNNFLETYNNIYPIDFQKAKTLIKEATQYYNGKISIPPYVKKLEEQWYNSLSNNHIDYSVYNDEYYFTDIWSCWHLYSRKYILSIKQDVRIFDYFHENVNSIVDLGCGIGYSTAMLKQMFPKANVYGTNLASTKQYNFCYQMSKKYDFELVCDVKDINKQIDLVFASEYFEHIEDTIDHLQTVINTLNPKCLFLANSFNTQSLGHFTRYKCYDQNIVSRKFNNVLKNNGYITMKTKLWNNKPRLWIKNES